MALSYPIDPGRPQVFKQQPVGSELSSANAYRPLDSGVAVDLVHFDPDSGSWTPAPDATQIDGLSARPAALGGTVTVLRRGSEIADTSIRFGDLDIIEVVARLREIGFVVRESVLPPEPE